LPSHRRWRRQANEIAIIHIFQASALTIYFYTMVYSLIK